VPPLNRADRRKVLLRSLSSLVLAPPFLAAIYFGFPYFDVLVAAGGALAAWEWWRLCAPDSRPLAPLIVIAGGVLLTCAAGALDAFSTAGWLIAVVGMAAALVGARAAGTDARWLTLGAVYLPIACLALLWLRHVPDLGRGLMFWLVALVWATDVGAYFVGRTVGGPLLAPRISPKKTWAGLFGGMLAAGGVGLAAALLRGGEEILALILASAALALLSQVGDLIESRLKRRAGAKDSGTLIPGHGGLLDRVDGLLAAAVAAGALIGMTGAFL